MEAPALPDLTWIPAPIEADLATNAPLYIEVVEIVLVGPERADFDIELAYDAESGRYYGLLGHLLGMLGDESWRPIDVRGFEIEGLPVTAGVCRDLADGVLKWKAWAEEAERIRAAAAAPPPEAAEVARMPLLDETWEVVEGLLGWIEDPENDEPGIAYSALVFSSEGTIRASAVHIGPHPPDALAALVRRAARSGPYQREGRPQAVHVADAARVRALTPPLRTAGIDVRATATPRGDAVLAEALDELRPPSPPPVFAGIDRATIGTFFDAAHAFYHARPWERLRGDRYLAFRFDDGPWRYANVMGQMNEAPGLSLFDDWLHVCRLVHNASTIFEMLTAFGTDDARPSLLEAVSAAEAITLCEPIELHPEDVLHLEALRIRPLRGGYPAPQRRVLDGYESPGLPLPAHAALMNAIVTIVKRRSTSVLTSIKKTVRVDDTDVHLRYPARGDEEGRPAGTVRLVVHGAAGRPSPSTLPAERTLHVDAPAATPLKDIAKAVDAVLDDRAWGLGFGAGRICLWSDRLGRGTPCPFAADLIGTADAWMEMNGDRYRLEATRRLGDAREVEVTVR